jgi:8-amino-7-oxononanoate synthase
MTAGLWFERLKQDLARLQAQGRRRTLSRLDGAVGPEVAHGGRPVINLAGNDYLGLSRHPAVTQVAARAVMDLGAGAGASRLMGGDLDIHHQLERAVARFKGAGEAIIFSSGYLANLGVVTALTEPGDLIVSDELNHASLIDACRLSRAETVIYPHGDHRAAARILALQPPDRRVLIVTDGVFSMDGDLAPLVELAGLADDYRALLVVDDAHGTGVLGATGRGTAEHLGVTSPGLIQMGTFSKALGSLGGFVVGNELIVESLRQKARSFIYTTALPPAVVAASLAALEAVDDEPWRRMVLADHAARLRVRLTDLGYVVPEGITPIVPVMIGTEADVLALSGRLMDEGVFAPAVRPPTVPEGKCRLRLSLRADHAIVHLERVIAAFARAGDMAGRERAMG